MEKSAVPEAAISDAHVQAAREVFVQWVKGLKGIGLFRHNENRYASFLEPAHLALTKYLDNNGKLTLEVGPEAFSLRGESLLPAGNFDKLPFRFYSGGIRRLMFEPGISLDELRRLSLVAIGDVDPKRRNDDIVSALWAAQLTHIRQVSVEGFTVKDVHPEEVERQVTALLADIARRAASQRVMLADEPDEAIRPLSLPSLPERSKQELAQDEQVQCRKVVGVLWEVLAGEPAENIEGLDALLLDVIDWMLDMGDYGACNQILMQLPARAAAPRLMETLFAKLGEPQRVAAVLERLGARPPEKSPDVVFFLCVLPPGTDQALLEGLDKIEIPESRRVICDALARLIRDPAVLSDRLERGTPQLVRDMLYVLEKLEGADKSRAYASALKSRNAEVRLAVLDMVVQGKAPGAKPILTQATTDPDPRVKLRATRGLIELDPTGAFRELSAQVQSPNFAKHTPEEQIATYELLGSTGIPEAEAFLTRVYNQPAGGLFGKQKVARDKVMALAGLAEVGTIGAFRLLQAEAQKVTDPELRAMARRGAAKIQAKFSRKPAPGKGGA
jgi:hypothetical protein